MIMFNIRKKAFVIKDNFNKNSIMREYNDIKYILEGNSNNDDLKKILNHAKNNCPFYKNIDIHNFTSIPILTRDDLIQHEDKIIAKNYVNKPYRVMQTSGSSGKPLKIKQDLRKKARSLADVIYFNEQAGQQVGQRYIFLRGWIKNYRKSKLEQFATNLIPIDVTTLNEENLENLYQLLLKDKHINCILGYASTLDTIADYIITRKNVNNQFSLKSIISSSEVLTQATVRKLKRVFSCNIASRYANQECGILGQADMNDGIFKMNKASYKIEVLKLDSDEAVSEGEIGRIVVTDLFNYYTPLLRYDTGDLGILLNQEKGYLKEIIGRKGDMISTADGSHVSLTGFSNHMEVYTEIEQYQLVQRGQTDYLLKIKLKSKERLTDIRKTVLGILGENIELHIEIVDSFPLMPSGKFKTMVNETGEKIIL